MVQYNYICRKCEKIKIVMAKDMNPPDAPICDECNEEMKRDWGDVAVIFKGKGFYTTDNKE